LTSFTDNCGGRPTLLRSLLVEPFGREKMGLIPLGRKRGIEVPLRMDQAVVRSVLDVLQPLGIEASLRAQENSRQAQSHKQKLLDMSIQKAKCSGVSVDGWSR
jgi:hypothetical protein